MKLCDTCIYRNENEYHKPCIVYRDDCEFYEKERGVMTDDLISRQAVIDGINRYFHDEYYQRTSIQDCRDCLIEDVIKDIPPVNPQEPKTGHWEWVQYDYNPKLGNWHCSECRCVVIEYVDKNEKGGIPLYNYCPNCGAKMIEPQAGSEDKEWVITL